MRHMNAQVNPGGKRPKRFPSGAWRACKSLPSCPKGGWADEMWSCFVGVATDCRAAKGPKDRWWERRRGALHERRAHARAAVIVPRAPRVQATIAFGKYILSPRAPGTSWAGTPRSSVGGCEITKPHVWALLTDLASFDLHFFDGAPSILDLTDQQASLPGLLETTFRRQAFVARRDKGGRKKRRKRKTGRRREREASPCWPFP